MLEARIQSSRTIPQRFQYLEDLKQRSELFEAKLRSAGLKNHADRVERCADLLTTRVFGNGYSTLKRAWFCKVRGCPLCERTRGRQVLGRIAEGIGKARAMRPCYQYILLTMSSQLVEVGNLKKEVASMRAATERLCKRDVFKGEAWVKLSSFVCMGEAIAIQQHILVMGSTAFCSGRNYVKRDEWNRLWRESCRDDNAPPVTVKRLDGDRNEIMGYIKSIIMAQLPYAMIPDSIFKQFFEQTARAQLFSMCGLFGDLMKERERPKPKKMFPSELKNFRRSHPEYYGYTPNPDDEHHRNQYLEIPEPEEDLF